MSSWLSAFTRYPLSRYIADSAEQKNVPMLANCHAAHGVLFSAGLLATNMMSVHSQNSKCEGSKISLAKHCLKVALHVQLVIHRAFCTLVLSLTLGAHARGLR